MFARRALVLLSTILGAGFGLTACQGEGPPGIRTSGLALEAFGTCEELEQYVEDQAVELMKTRLRDDNWYAPRVLAGAEDNASARTGQGPSAYTKTNVQVEGVDEADFVKTNGTHIFVLTANRLYITKSWPAAELSVLSDVELEGYPSEMFLDEVRNRVVVLASVFAPYARRPDGVTIDCLAWGGCGEWAVASKLTVIDVSAPSAPRVEQEIYLPGWYQNARRIDGSVRVVLGDSFRWPDGVRWWPETGEDFTQPAMFDRDRTQLIAENERIIRAQTLRDWLPYPLRRLPDGTLIDVGYECSDFYHANTTVDLGFTTVATLDLDHPDAEPARTSIIAQTHEVYANQQSLYLSTWHWWWWPEPGQEDFTYLFKFDLTDPADAVFTAAGGVAGHILNQFSLDDHQGFLRVATTVARRVEDDDNEWGRLETANRVSVLAERSGALEVVGQTEDLAAGETIQSARFIGTRGFLVTFRQIDPLFALDLSNPENPRVVGELKVPGFSSYIHPLGDNHLLTIGVHMPDPGTGQVNWNERRMKLSIFDVTDLANPQELFTETVGTANGWSEAAWEHKAFNYFPERGLLAIPFSDYAPSATDYWGEFVSDLRVFDISTTAGIHRRGAITMKDIYQSYAYRDWTWSWSPWIRRSVMADDFVYAISDAGIRVAHQDTLATPIRTVQFDRVMQLE